MATYLYKKMKFPSLYRHINCVGLQGSFRYAQILFERYYGTNVLFFVNFVLMLVGVNMFILMFFLCRKQTK